MSTGKATSKSGRTFSVGSKCCGLDFDAAEGFAAAASGGLVAGAGVEAAGVLAGAGFAFGGVAAGGAGCWACAAAVPIASSAMARRVFNCIASLRIPRDTKTDVVATALAVIPEREP